MKLLAALLIAACLAACERDQGPEYQVKAMVSEGAEEDEEKKPE